jgi:hypothetical protein
VPRGGPSGSVALIHPSSFRLHEDSGSARKPLARSFAALLDRIADDPAKFLREVGCYTRYSDGKTDTQWIPNEFITEIAQSTWIG